MRESILRFYSAWFRYGGLVIAILSLAASLAFAYSALTAGYVLINGVPSAEVLSIVRVVATPLPGIVVGLALYFFVPKVATKLEK